MIEVSCKAVAMQNSSEWPYSMCPILQLRLVGVSTSYYIFFYYFLDTLSSGPHYKSLFVPPAPPQSGLYPVTAGCLLGMAFHNQGEFA